MEGLEAETNVDLYTNRNNHEGFTVRFPVFEIRKVDVASTSLTSSNMPKVQTTIGPPAEICTPPR